MTLSELEDYYQKRAYQVQNLDLAIKHFNIGSVRYSWEFLFEWGLLMHECDEILDCGISSKLIRASRGQL